MEYISPFLVAESDVAECHSCFCFGQGRGESLFSVGLLVHLLYLEYALTGGEGADNVGYELDEAACRPLYLSHELHEGYEGSVGDETYLEVICAPYESEEVGYGEAEIHYEVGGDRVACAVVDEAYHLALRLEGALYYLVGGTVDGLDDYTVSDAFLILRLQMAVGLAYLTRDAAHGLDIEFADDEEEWYDDYYEQGQGAVHDVEEDEGSDELRTDDDEGGEGVGDEADDDIDVFLYSVDYVAAMETLAGYPGCEQCATKDVHLHLVAGLD